MVAKRLCTNKMRGRSIRRRLLFFFAFFVMQKFLPLSLSDKKHKIAEDSKHNDTDKQEVVSEEIYICGVHFFD